MKILASIIALLILVPSTYAQGCYGGAYGQYQPVALATNFCTAQVAQTYVQTVQVPVTIAVPVQTVVTQQVVAAPVCQAVSLPLASYSSVGLANYGAVGVSHYGAVGLGMGYGGIGFANRSAFVGGNRFAVNRGVSVAGQGVAISAQDRRGTQVVASGVNNVRIQRGLLGRINGATADRGGLLSRLGL
jgi:hypothetical protein